MHADGSAANELRRMVILEGIPPETEEEW